MKYFPWKRALRKKTIWFCLAVMTIFALVSIFAPWISPHNPYDWDLTRDNLPPMWVHNVAASGTPEYPLGTDYYGRDILSRLIYGTRTAFLLAMVAVPLTALFGTMIGLFTGFKGGKAEKIIGLLIEIIQSLPGIMFLVMIVLIFRNLFSATWFHGFLTLVIGYAAVSWVSLAQMIRVSVIQLKSQLFIEAAVSIGASPRRIVFKHLLPNVLHIILVWIINNIPMVILLEAILGYIGVGLTSATGGGEFIVASYGGLFYSGRMAFSRNPLMLVMPSLCILLISMSFILLADYLNDLSQG